MDLRIQIYSFVISFLYGIFFYIMFRMCRKLIYHKKLGIKIFVNFCFVTLNALLYFFILRFINEGVFHIYFIFTLILGCFLTFFTCKKMGIV